MIATLPMYDWPEVREATDRYWAAIRDGLAARGIAAPGALHRGDRWNDWLAPDLILSQTCGLPYRTQLHGKVTLVGTPDFGLPGLPAGHYCSVLVTRADETGDWTRFADRRLAINGTDSQSGFAAPQNHAAARGLRFDTWVVTGAHVASAQAVADGRADIAAIDAVTWRLITTHRRALAATLRVAERTDPTPGLPYIAALGSDAEALFAAAGEAIARLAPADRAALGLTGMVRIPASAYLAVPVPPGANG